MMPNSSPSFVVPPGYRLSGPDSFLCDDKFDWDAIKNNPNLELWLIRMPNNLSAKHLESVKLSPSSSLHPSKLGELTHKAITYDIWSQNPVQSNANEDKTLQQPTWGEEMKSITCLLPRQSSGGRLYAAPRPIARHVTIATKPGQTQPVTGPASSPSTSVTVYHNPPRQSYPPDLLKHRFTPYGSLAPIAEQEYVTSKFKDKDNSRNQSATSTSATTIHMDSKTVPPCAKETKKEHGEQNAADGDKLSKSKKRKSDKDVNEVKKSKKLRTKSA